MTIKDLARLSGYSLGTVSRVLNNQPNVSEQARSTILALVEQHGFERNASAQLLKQQRSKSVLIVVKGTSNEMFAAMVETLQSLFADTDHPVMKNVPATFTIESDEWYTYNRNPRKEVHVLAHVDECSYKTDTKVKMGDHPVIWTNTQKPARNVYFQFGHSKALLENAAFLQMFENALHWTLRDK